MDEQILDCRGLACPKPVLETKEAIEAVPEGEEITLVVIVDNEAARGNVTRFAESQGCEVKVIAEPDGEYKLFIRRGKGYKKTPVDISCPAQGTQIPRNTLGERSEAVVFKSDTMGHGDHDLGRTLVDAFCHTLLELKPPPGVMVFYNRGVYLATSGSVVLDALKEFESRGTRILVCGTCLRHYGIEDSLEVGEVSNMFEILESLRSVDRVLTP